jgi:hypothetical protein
LISLSRARKRAATSRKSYSGGFISMLQVRHRGALSAFALLSTLFGSSMSASDIKTVFVIAMENHNWTQPANEFIGPIQQIYKNPDAPFINSLVNGVRCH